MRARSGASRAARVVLLLAFTGGPAGAVPNIPALAWTERSDWHNVRTDNGTNNAAGDGVADDTAALQAALSRFTGTAGGSKVVYLPRGTYRIAGTLTWPSSVGCTLIGHGRDTRILWDGAAGGTMLRTDGAAHCNVIGVVWDGGDRTNNVRGFLHNAASRFESFNRHQHEAFLNLNVGLQGTYGDMGSGTLATSEMLIDNCLFVDCGTGIHFANSWNYYNETITRCEFLSCGLGVRFGAGYGYVRFCHFENSAVGDIQGAGKCSARFCTSRGSAAFYNPGDLVQAIVQNCTVADCAASNAVRGADGSMVFDNFFQNPPAGATPVFLSTGNAIVCSNRSPGAAAVYGGAGGYREVPPGAHPPLTLAADRSFLQQTVSVSTVVFDARTDFGAPSGGDDTARMQACIDAARNAGNGAVAYFPNGQYKVGGTLNVSGSNYVISGNGYYSEWKWTGATQGVVVSVVDPRDIRIEYLSLPNHLLPAGTTAIRQTGTSGVSSVTYDRLELPDGPAAYSLARPREGLHLVSLPAGAAVRVGQVIGTVRLSDCGQATVLGELMNTSGERIEGALLPKTGFIGFASRNGLNLLVADNNDVVVGDCNMEQSGPWYQPDIRSVWLAGGARSGPGRVTIGAMKMDLFDSPTLVQSDNYEGDFALLHANVAAQYAFYQSLHGGTRPLRAVYAAGNFPNSVHLVERSGSAVSLANVRNVYGYGMPSEWYGQGAAWIASSQAQAPTGACRALRFDGVDDVIFGAKDSGVSTSLTVMAWVRPATTGSATIVSCESPESNAVNTAAFALQVVAGGRARFLVRSAVSPYTAFAATNTTVLPTNVWKLLAGTWDGAQVRLFVDGVEEGAAPAAFASLGAGSGSHMNRLLFGGAPGRCFAGDLDEVRLYGSALADAAIAAAWNGGAGTCGATNDPGLVAGYHFDEGADRNAFDYKGVRHGLLHQFGVDATPGDADASLAGAIDHLRDLGRNLLAIGIAPYQYALTVGATAGGTAAGGGTWSQGAWQPILATPAWNYDFAGWTGAGIADTNGTDTTVFMDAPKTVLAAFTPKTNPGCLLTLVASPAAWGSVSGGGVYPTNAIASISATAAVGYVFLNWSGAGVANPTGASTTVAMDATRTVTALFAPRAPTFVWANANVAGAPAPSLNWFGAPQGLWTGDGSAPISSNLTVIRFFQDAVTALANTSAPSAQTSAIDNGGAPFQLRTLTLAGKASAAANASLTVTLAGDALHFSGAAGTVNLDASNATRTVSYDVHAPILLGTADNACVLTAGGNGNGTFRIGGNIAEGQAGGGRLVKTGLASLVLLGTNAFSGGVTIEAGGVYASGASTNVLGIGRLTMNGGLFSLHTSDGRNPAHQTVGSIAGTGGTIRAGNRTLTFGGDNTSTAFLGNWDGGTFTKTGAGTTLVFGAGSTVSSVQGVNVSQGTLRLGASKDLTQPVSVKGTLDLNGYNASVNLGNLSAGASIVTGGGTFSNVVAYQAINVGGAAGTALFLGNWALPANPNFRLDANTLLIVDGVLTGGSGCITNNGNMSVSGVIRLAGSANNTFGGVWSVGNGTTELNKVSGAVAIPGDVSLASGALKWLGNDQIADAATVTLTGSARLVLNGRRDRVRRLFFGAVRQADGTWGGSGSGARYTNTAYFASGAGVLTVGRDPGVVLTVR
jgi:autotransporter-associated beta strand protein